MASALALHAKRNLRSEALAMTANDKAAGAFYHYHRLWQPGGQLPVSILPKSTLNIYGLT